jgi:hypothetical protein
MKHCSICAGTVEEGAPCARCGAATPEGAPSPPRIPRAARLLVAAAMLAALTLVALPALARFRSSDGCEPRTWLDWHVAIKQACLTPAYVCENMTSAKLLADPDVLASYRRALEAGEAGAIGHLDALVDHLRGAYGCDGAAEGAPGPVPAAPRLPPGHPPIPGHGSSAVPFPGHPPIRGGAPFPGHPPVGGRPAAPMFEAPGVVTI